MSNDPFDEARSAFVKMDDMLGRVVLVIPKESREAVSTLPGSQGKTYTKVIADTYVLSGEPTDAIPTVPFLQESMHWSGMAVTNQLLPKIATGRAVIGVVKQIPSQTKGFGPAWILDNEDLTDANRQAARDAWAEYQARFKDPFDTASA